jgi:hypothetical protein
VLQLLVTSYIVDGGDIFLQDVSSYKSRTASHSEDTTLLLLAGFFLSLLFGIEDGGFMV